MTRLAELRVRQGRVEEAAQLLAAIHGNQEAMDDFARVNAGVLSPAQFFSQENIGRITQAGATAHA
jgi:hypothetical protein